MKPTLYIVEDDISTQELLREIIGEDRYNLRFFLSPLKALDTVNREGLPEIVLTDLMMPEMDGIELLSRLKAINPQMPVVMMTAHGSIETAVEALKRGAFDYITKPLSFEELIHTLDKAFEVVKLRLRVDGFNFGQRREYAPSSLVGESESTKKIRSMLLKISSSATTSVILRGESGTGKNLAAKIIHYNGDRSQGPIIECNCAAIPANLLESELFGHKKGSFTGATENKAGIIEQADGGTLFLDEIAEMPLELQSKLLSFLESRKLRRLGELSEREVDIRLITATNRNLEKMVEEGMFRQDLFFRINVVSCELPPLRKMERDVIHIASKYIDEFNQHFNKRVTGLTQSAESVLLSHSWPGNVRELKNVIERAMLFSEKDFLADNDLQITFSGQKSDEINSGEGFQLTRAGLDWEKHEKDILSQALELTDRNQSKAARLLGMSRDTFIYRLKKYELD